MNNQEYKHTKEACSQATSVQSKDNEQRDNDAYSTNFARIPNILFASYKHLTKEEKFLYCTLKSIYWDAKPRYVSLRELAEASGYSSGALSKMLPRLHTCELIHAEIRRESKGRSQMGQSKYYITILDIWELNRQYYSCPPDERSSLDPSLALVHEMDASTSKSVHQMNASVHQMNASTPKSVHQMNASVHQMNAFDPVSEPLEPVQPPSKDSNKDNKKKERKPASAASTPASTFSLSQKNTTAVPSVEQREISNKSARPTIVLSERAQTTYEHWCHCPWFRDIAPGLTPTVARHCETIATFKQLPTTEDMVNTRHWYAKKYPDQQGFRLGNFVSAYPEYLSDQYRPKPAPAYKPKPILTREQLKNLPV